MHANGLQKSGQMANFLHNVPHFVLENTSAFYEPQNMSAFYGTQNVSVFYEPQNTSVFFGL